MWPERLLQVALNIRGMIDDTGTAPFYARAVEHTQEGLREKLGESEVTVEGAMGEMGLNYFTAYHVIKRLEREGELLPEEGITGIREWHWIEE